MTVIDGLQFTQLTNLNVTGEIYEHGVPFGGVTAPIVLSTANNPLEQPLGLRGGATNGDLNYNATNSGLVYNDGADTEIWRIWASNPTIGIGVNPAANSGNLYLGFEAGALQPTQTESASAGYGNTGMGYSVLASALTANANTAFGFLALTSVASEDFNSAFGFGALQFNTNHDNTAMGAYALCKNISGADNTAVGAFALNVMADASNSTAVGSSALAACKGENNTAVGMEALVELDGGENNVAVGQGSLGLERSGSNNVAVGQEALMIVDGGDDNTAVGRLALLNLDSGSNNLGLGHNVGGILLVGSRNTVIGHNADFLSGDPSDELSLCNMYRGTDLLGASTGPHALIDGEDLAIFTNKFFVENLPTSSPTGANQVWRDGNTLMITDS